MWIKTECSDLQIWKPNIQCLNWDILIYEEKYDDSKSFQKKVVLTEKQKRVKKKKMGKRVY